MITDPIADMLTCIRNAAGVRRQKVSVHHSNIKRHVADLLLAEGFLASVQEAGEGSKRSLEIEIKYLPNGTTPVIKGLQRVSSPGQRRYASFDAIPRVRSGLGLSILSTSRGVMTDREARKQKVGGEIICTVW